MKYEDVRSIAEDGDIIFLHVNKKDILSRITSYFTKSPYTHAAFVFWYGGRLMVVESTTHGGSRIITASHYHGRNIDLVSAPKQWDEIVETALERSGTAKYGWFSAMYIGLREVMFNRFNVKLPQDRNNRNKACSEFVAEVLGLEDVDLSPGQLYNTLKIK